MEVETCAIVVFHLGYAAGGEIIVNITSWWFLFPQAMKAHSLSQDVSPDCFAADSTETLSTVRDHVTKMFQ